MHSSEFKDAKDYCTGKKVVIIGSRKSALDIAGQAFRYGGDCTIAIRRAHWLLPGGISIFGAPLSTFVSSRMANLFLYPFYDDQDNVFFKYCQPFIKLYWWFVTRKIKEGLPQELVPKSEYHRDKHFIGGARN